MHVPSVAGCGPQLSCPSYVTLGSLTYSSKDPRTQVMLALRSVLFRSPVTHYLALTAAEPDGGGLSPNLVRTQVSIHICQDRHSVNPLRTIPHPAQVHRFGAIQQTHS